jgi:predicted naringenin-chalcone synthase
VPDTVASYLPNYLQTFLDKHHLTQNDLDFWAIHPGGRKIIEKVQSGFELSDRMVADSYDILRRYGNMSSPTVLFILKEILAKHQAGLGVPFENGIALGFGPGLSIDSCLFQKI